MWFAGVDPGLNGSVAFFSQAGSMRLLIYDFITEENKVGRTRRRNIKIPETANIFKQFIAFEGLPHIALVETPHSMPTDGHVGAFKFGKVCGILEGMIGALGIQSIGIVPAVWKSRLGLTSKKEDSLVMARKVFGPDHSHYFTLKKHNDRAEAALLAWYAWKTFGGGN